MELVLKSTTNSKIALRARVITGSTYNIRSIDVLNTLGWETLDQKRNCTKLMPMYKIINDHAVPNLNVKQSFRLYSEGDTMHDLRNHATDLVLPKPKREFGIKSFEYKELFIGIFNQMKLRMRIPLLH